jgi:hypothetical protein
MRDIGLLRLPFRILIGVPLGLIALLHSSLKAI